MQDTIQNLISRLKAAGIKLTFKEKKVQASSPNGPISPELSDEITANEASLFLIFNKYLAAESHSNRGGLGPKDSATFPLSHAQLRFWFLEKLKPGSNRYKLVLLRDIAAEVDAKVLLQAVSEITRRHSSLRTVFNDQRVPPVQVVLDADAVPVNLRQSDLSALPESEQNVCLDQITRAETNEDFKFAERPAFRLHLVKLAEDHFTLIVAMHHLISDGWSVNIFFRELVTIYDALVRGRASSLKALPSQYSDFVRWQHNRLDPASYNELLRYWQAIFRDIPDRLQLPNDGSIASPEYKGAAFRWSVQPRVMRDVSGVARITECTQFIVLLAAYAIVIARFTGREDLCIGTPVAGRNAAEFLPLIGCFADTLPLRIAVDPSKSFRENLLGVREVVFGALAHQEMPFNSLVEALNPPRDDESSPIFQVLFALHTEKRFSTVPRVGLGRVFKARRKDSVAPRYEISLDMYPNGGGGLAAVAEYNEGRVSSGTLTNLMECMGRLIEKIPTHLDKALSEIDISSVDDHLVFQGQLVETRRPFDGHSTPYKLFLAQAQEHPDLIAIEDGNLKISYRALMAEISIAADGMRKLGIGEGHLVAVVLDRSIELITALLAVWSTGAAYLPLDPIHPPQRLAAMLLDAKPAAILFDSGFLKSGLLGVEDRYPLSEKIHVAIWPDRISSPVPLFDRSAAYAIYTSGSTGTPKAVVVTHPSLVNLVQHMKREHSVSIDDVVLSVTSPSFDLGGLDIFLALCCGGRLVLASRPLSMDAPRLLRLIEGSGITILQATPATWGMLKAACDREISLAQRATPNIRVAICGGEALSQKLVPFLCHFACEAWNYYGPTETTVWSTAQRLSETEVLSIGCPISNTQVLIMDSAGNILPLGAIGELWISGAGVALGYLNRSELTAEKFVTASILDGNHRFYRTGDIGRYRDDGTLQLIGRNDRQTKIRGFRVELEEIESALGTIEGVGNACVRQETNETGASGLSGFVVPSGSMDSVDAQTIRHKLGELLPQYMVPDVIYLVPKICLTVNAKVDWVATKLGALASAGRDDSLSGTPLTPTEIALRDIWSQLLKTESVFSNSDFFSLGGHSLLVLELLAQIEKGFEIDIDLSTLFRYSTLGSMASRIDLALSIASSSRRLAEESGEKPKKSIEVGEYLTLSQRTLSSELISSHQHVFHVPLATEKVMEYIYAILGKLESRHPILAMILTWNNGEVLLVPGDDAVNVKHRLLNYELQKRDGASDQADKRPLSLCDVGLYDLTYLPSFPNSKFGALQFRLDATFLDHESCSIIRRSFNKIADSIQEDGMTMPSSFTENNFLEYLDRRRYRAETEAEAYWTKKGAQVSPILDFGGTRPEFFTKRAKRVFRTLTAAEAEPLHKSAADYGCSISQIVLAAFGLILGRSTDRDEVAIAMQTSRRTGSHLADAVGVYQSQFYVNLRLGDDPSLSSCISLATAEFREALSFSAAPPAVVWGPIPRRPSRSYGSPISAFYLHNEMESDAIRFPTINGSTACDLTLVTQQVKGKKDIGFSLKYYSDAISMPVADGLIDSVVGMLKVG